MELEGKIISTLHAVQPHPRNFGWTGKTFGMFAIHNWALVGSQTEGCTSKARKYGGFKKF
jgi:hypothetical protein